ADQAYGEEFTLEAGASTVYDLYGTLSNGIGGTVNIAKLKFLGIQSGNAATDDAGILVGAPTTGSEYFELDAEYGGTLPHEEAVPPGGLLIRANPVGWTITNGSNDWLWLHNHGTQAATFQLIIVGGSL